MADPRTILAAAGVSVPELEKYENEATVYEDGNEYGSWVVVHKDDADAAILALAGEVARLAKSEQQWTWVAAAKVAEECVYGDRAPDGVIGCDWCRAEIDRLLARYAEEVCDGSC